MHVQWRSNDQARARFDAARHSRLAHRQAGTRGRIRSLYVTHVYSLVTWLCLASYGGRSADSLAMVQGSPLRRRPTFCEVDMSLPTG